MEEVGQDGPEELLRGFHGEDLESMAARFEAAVAAESVAEGVEFRDVDLFDAAGVEVDDQVVGRAAIDELVVGLVAVFLVEEEDAVDDAGFLQETDGAVDRGLGDVGPGGFQGGEEFFSLEETIHADNGVEDVGAFGGVLKSLGFELAAEDSAEGLDDLEVGVGWGKGLKGHVGEW